MALYEIINPSDGYTIESNDEMTVCASVIILGRGQYGLTNEDGEDVLPILIFGNPDEFFKSKFECTFMEAMKKCKPNIPGCLETVLIGDFNDRRTFFENNSREDKEFENKRDVYHDKKRSSMNDIGANAYRLAKTFR